MFALAPKCTSASVSRALTITEQGLFRSLVPKICPQRCTTHTTSSNNGNGPGTDTTAPVGAPTIVSSLSSRELSELVCSLVVLRLCSFDAFAKNGEKLYNFGRRLIGKRLTDAFVEKTFYRQFIAGNCEEKLSHVASALLSHNILTMVCPPMEDLDDSASPAVKFAQRKANSEKFKCFLNVSSALNDQTPRQAAVMQVKLSGIFSVRSMNDLSAAIRRRNIPLGVVIDDFADAIGGNSTNRNQESYGCTPDGIADLRTSLAWYADVLKYAAVLNIPLLIDAELRAAHEAMYAIGYAASLVYNKSEAVIFNTYQCYLKDTLAFLEETRKHCRAKGVAFGAKLVRGAYMNTERKEALRTNIRDPVWPTFEATSENYDLAVSTVLSWIKEGPNSNGLFVASHNSGSVNRAIAEMERLNIEPSSKSVKFAQIYGMCDHLSCDIASKGYRVYKSVPFGHLQEWIPYMVRRASENHTAFRTARNEVPHYVAEILNRFRRKRSVEQNNNN